MKRLLVLLSLFISANAIASKPTFTSQSYLIADSTGEIIKEHNSNAVRPIASISKLIVALLASEQNLDEDINIPSRRIMHSHIPKSQLTMTRKELLTLALVRSDNFAAQILCLNISNCIESMNKKAIELGMLHTKFDDPTGLSINNVSTASDLLKLMLVASNNQLLSDLSSMPTAIINTGKNIIQIKNTNPLTGGKLQVFLSKTGFTNPAGGCIVMAINSPIGQRFLILLGSRNTRTRITEISMLAKSV